MNILQVSTNDIAGGAAKVAWNLFQAYRTLGHRSTLVVGHKQSTDSDVLLLSKNRVQSQWFRIWRTVGDAFLPFVGKIPGADRLRSRLHLIGEPKRLLDLCLGYEDFNFPETWKLFDLIPGRPDIVHCHNLHGSYFDLRILPWLSQQVPVVLTLNDAWLLSGHCAHSFDCERWKTGCGDCPDLTIYPSIRRDATAHNWNHKKRIFARSRLYIATSCQWMMQRVRESMLSPAMVDSRIIPDGIDLSVFHPADRRLARSILDVPQDVKLLLFVARDARRNIWKDFQTLKSAVARVSQKLPQFSFLLVVIGENAPVEQIGRAEARFIQTSPDPSSVVPYYQAADLYVHAAKVDTFPNTILEALACGTPVVATAVGGIPEQVRELNTYGFDEGTGMLVPTGESEAMATGIAELLINERLRYQLGTNAYQDARERFPLQRQVSDYLSWYQEILEKDANLYRHKALA